jgi:hypothetical protein
MEIKRYTNPRGQIVGYMKEDKVYRREAVMSKHHLRMMGGAWGISMEIFNKLREDGCETIEIKTDTGKTYTVSVSVMEVKGKRITLDDPQIVLPDKFFTIS